MAFRQAGQRWQTTARRLASERRVGSLLERVGAGVFRNLIGMVSALAGELEQLERANR